MCQVYSPGLGSAGAYARLTDSSQSCNSVSRVRDMAVRQGSVTPSSDDGARGQFRLQTAASSSEGHERRVERHAPDRQSDAVLTRLRQLVAQSNAAGKPSAYVVAASRAPSPAACSQARDGSGRNSPGTLSLDITQGNDPAGRGFFGGIGDGISHFCSKVVSWWRDGDVNRAIKTMVHGALANQIARLERCRHSESNPIIANELHRKIRFLEIELLCLVDPSSDWPLDIRDVAWLNFAIDSVRKLLPQEGGRK